MPEYGWRTWEVRGRSLVAKGQGLASTCGGRVPHGPASSLAACGTRAPHVGWLAWSLNFVDKNALLPILFKSLQFPPFVSKKKNCEIPSMFFSPIFSTSKYHNFLIRSRNWVIQVGDCSYLSHLPFPSGLSAVWLNFWEIYSENRTSSCNQGSVHNFVISSF